MIIVDIAAAVIIAAMSSQTSDIPQHDPNGVIISDVYTWSNGSSGYVTYGCHVPAEQDPIADEIDNIGSCDSDLVFDLETRSFRVIGSLHSAACGSDAECTEMFPGVVTYGTIISD